jgi:hypothetical protein
VLPELIVADVAAWRAWLSEHHARPGVWLVLAKKGTDEPTATAKRAETRARRIG